MPKISKPKRGPEKDPRGPQPWGLAVRYEGLQPLTESSLKEIEIHLRVLSPELREELLIAFRRYVTGQQLLDDRPTPAERCAALRDIQKRCGRLVETLVRSPFSRRKAKMRTRALVEALALLDSAARTDLEAWELLEETEDQVATLDILLGHYEETNRTGRIPKNDLNLIEATRRKVECLKNLLDQRLLDLPPGPHKKGVKSVARSAFVMDLADVYEKGCPGKKVAQPHRCLVDVDFDGEFFRFVKSCLSHTNTNLSPQTIRNDITQALKARMSRRHGTF